jgi:mannose-6-phosphate isomerase-like protein (cupin superfamily)
MTAEPIARSHVYAFDAAVLREQVAHGGFGAVHAARVLDRGANESLRFVDLVEVPPGSTIGRHRHGADRELYIAISGHAIIELDGEEIPLGPGDVAVNRPGGTHALTVTGDEVFRMVVVCAGA